MSSENTPPADPATSRPSRLGRASVVLGVISLAILVLCGCLLSFAFVARLLVDLGDSGAGNLFGLVMELGFLMSPMLSLTGICLGIAGLFRKNCRRGPAVLGLLLNVIALSVFVLVCSMLMAAVDGMIAC